MKRTFLTLLALVALALPASAITLDRAEVNGGVGVGDFTRDVGNLTGAGFAWNGRLDAMMNRWVGGEISYLGLNTGLHTLFPSAGTVLSDRDFHQNQFSVNAVGELPMTLRQRLFAPYVFAGLGYARLSTDAAVNAAGLGDSNSFAVPIGVGAKYDLTDALQLDGRFTYNFLTNVDTPLAQSAGSWTAMIDIGAHLGG